MAQLICKFANNSAGPEVLGPGSSIPHFTSIGCAISGFNYEGRCDLRLYAGRALFPLGTLQRPRPYSLALLMHNKQACAPYEIFRWRRWQRGCASANLLDLAPSGNSSNILGLGTTLEGWEPNRSNQPLTLHGLSL
jgi:hypothetical protein